MLDADVIIIGGGLAGLVAATELTDAGKKVIVVDQEPRHSLGGQAFWSLGGLFLVDSPEQRRLGIKDSEALAWQDWMGAAAFDRADDYWPKRWAEAYVAFASGEKRSWLRAIGHRLFPIVGWAERGGGNATGHGNSVPRFHLTWGAGPGVVEPFARKALDAEQRGRLDFRFRHRVDGLLKDRTHSHRRARRDPRTQRNAARRKHVAPSGRRLRASCSGGRRGQRRHRRQP